MRGDEAVAPATDRVCERESRGGRVVVRLLSCWSRRCIGLVVLAAVFAPWRPNSTELPAATRSRRTSGIASSPIVSLAFAPDGRSIATTDQAGQATLWQAADDWASIRTLKYSGRAAIVRFSPDGRYLALCGDDPRVRVWDLAEGDQQHWREIPARSPSDLSFSPDGLSLAVSSYDSSEITLWDVSGGQKRLALKGHLAPVMRLAFAPDGHALASATGTVHDPRILIWNLATGKPERAITLASAPQAMAFSSDSRLLAFACPHEKAVRIWDTGPCEQVQVIAGHALSTRSVTFSPDERLLLTGAGDGAVALWSVTSGHEVRRLDSEADVVHNVAFSRDGKTLIATANDGDIRVWELCDLITDRIE
jgi:WD40 repeat protein